MRILIANRGEIARRIERTAHRLGFETVAAYADPDRDAPFVREATISTRLGPAALAESYLSEEALLAAAKRTNATAIHPGYGFLSENAAFARAVEAAGLTWIGPNADAIDRMGSKIEARKLADEADVPTIPGHDGAESVEAWTRAAERIGFPVLIKASAGGGGKGIRIVHEAEALATAVEEASREAERSFKDGALIVERYVERARHVEVQIVGDRKGQVIDLGTRECSIQRRYQKLFEEAPAPNLPEATERGLRESARALARTIGYDSTGTVEYVVDDATGDYYFLEMNTRLQVEHPVTEATTGLDLVELQLLVASGAPLPIRQDEIRFEGHAFEARINAEDPRKNYVPRTGRITSLRVPTDVRWDSGVEAGSEITPYYDSMVAKLITFGSDREGARRRMRCALDNLLVGGLTTNTGFHRWLVDHPEFVDATATTRFLDENEYAPAATPDEAAQIAASAWRAARREERRTRDGVWGRIGSFRVTPDRPSLPIPLRVTRRKVIDVLPLEATLSEDGTRLDLVDHESAPSIPVEIDLGARRVALNLGGETFSFDVLTRSEAWAGRSGGAGEGEVESILSPFPAVVAEIPVTVGERVSEGAVVVVVEAMKMLHSLRARGPAVVKEIPVSIGDSVESNELLVRFESSAKQDAS